MAECQTLVTCFRLLSHWPLKQSIDVYKGVTRLDFAIIGRKKNKNKKTATNFLSSVDDVICQMPNWSQCLVTCIHFRENGPQRWRLHPQATQCRQVQPNAEALDALDPADLANLCLLFLHSIGPLINLTTSSNTLGKFSNF